MQTRGITTIAAVHSNNRIFLSAANRINLYVISQTLLKKKRESEKEERRGETLEKERVLLKIYVRMNHYPRISERNALGDQMRGIVSRRALCE